MFKKVLIANRGEIALRVIRTCREMGIKTVAVYSEADRESLHVRFADEAVCIGPPMSKDSYLNVSQIIAAAEVTNAEAIHPGYGFLAENATFAEICNDSGYKFIGPTSKQISLMGDKALAKETMRAADVPTVPGSDGVVRTFEEAKALLKGITFPVIIKASAGGGGKGMRIARSMDEFENNYTMARTEAEKAFGNGDVYIEKYIMNPHHIEVQLLGDQYGNMIALGERDCSIQRRHQKLVEESPSPIVNTALREKLCEAAIRGAKSVGYEGAGTIEFLVDEDRNFYFMEMNTRVQVEHPVTEEVFGMDIIREQIAIAAGGKLTKKILKPDGHAIECRINAEDPFLNFRPSPGKILSWHQPGGFGVRVDSHAYAGYHIPQYYDSLIAKLIVHGKNREEAVRRMANALEEFIIEGIATTIPFHQQLMSDDRYNRGEFDTHFLEHFQFSS